MASRKTVASNNQNDTSANLLSQRNHLRSTHAPGGMKHAWEEAAVTFCTAWSRSSCIQSIAEMWSFVLSPEKKNITETFNSPISTPEAIPREQWLSNMGFYNSSWPQEHIVYWQSFPLLEFRILSFIFRAMCGAQLQALTPPINGSMSLAHLYYVLKQPDTHWLVSLLLSSPHISRLWVSCLCVCFHCAVM